MNPVKRIPISIKKGLTEEDEEEGEEEEVVEVSWPVELPEEEVVEEEEEEEDEEEEEGEPQGLGGKGWVLGTIETSVVTLKLVEKTGL